MKYRAQTNRNKNAHGHGVFGVIEKNTHYTERKILKKKKNERNVYKPKNGLAEQRLTEKN